MDDSIDLTHSQEHPLPAPLTAAVEPARRSRSRSSAVVPVVAAAAAAVVAVPDTTFVRVTRSSARRGQAALPSSSALPSRAPPKKRARRAEPNHGVALELAPASAEAPSASSSSISAGPAILRALDAPNTVSDPPPDHDAPAASSQPPPEAPSAPSPPPEPDAAPLSGLAEAMMCPVCMCPPRDASMTPCGHVLCGECLFLAVAGGIQRARLAPRAGDAEPQCPVCRTRIPGWDGKGGGVIALVLRVADAL